MDDQLLKMRREAAIALAKRSMLTVRDAEALMLRCGDNLELAKSCVAVSECFCVSAFAAADAADAIKAFKL